MLVCVSAAAVQRPDTLARCNYRKHPPPSCCALPPTAALPPRGLPHMLTATCYSLRPLMDDTAFIVEHRVRVGGTPIVP